MQHSGLLMSNVYATLRGSYINIVQIATQSTNYLQVALDNSTNINWLS